MGLNLILVCKGLWEEIMEVWIMFVNMMLRKYKLKGNKVSFVAKLKVKGGEAKG